LREFRGWAPKQTTTVTERDSEGRPSTWVTEVEARFDVFERDGWYNLLEYEDAVCPRCGNLRAVCSDPDTDWFPQLSRCWASASVDVVSRKWHRKHEKSSPDSAGYLPTDGGMPWVSTEDLTPDDDFV